MTSEHGWRFDAAAAPHRLIPSVRARSSLAAVLVVALALGSGAALLYFVLQRSLLSGLDTAATTTAGEVATQLNSNGVDGLDARLKATAIEGQLVQVLDASANVDRDVEFAAESGAGHRVAAAAEPACCGRRPVCSRSSDRSAPSWC